MFSAKSVKPAASRSTLLHCNWSQLGGAGDDGRFGNRVLAFQAPRQSWTRAIALSPQMNFGVPKCRRSAVGAARVDSAKSLRNSAKRPIDRCTAAYLDRQPPRPPAADYGGWASLNWWQPD
jgi:hypothetical protein